jgi:type VI secretion system protein ImpA
MEKGMPTEKRIPKPAGSPEWVVIRDKALGALARSKDLRLLATLGTALMRTDGVPAFSETLNVASQWLETYWGQIYPLVDEDVIARRNALNCFADPMAVVDALRRSPLVSSRQHGTFSLRDIDIATGQVMPATGDTRADEKQVNAAFAAMPLEDLALLHDSVAGAVDSLKKIDKSMSDAAGSEATPDFGALEAQFGRIGQVLRAQLALRPAGTPAAGVEAAPDSPVHAGSGPVVSTGVIQSRQDAIRVLDAVAEFFKRTEPSSPIPLFLARAKRLVSKDFLEVLEDIVPDAVAQARAAGGLKTENTQE